MSNNASILIRASGHTRSNRKEHSRQQALWVAACLVLLATVALAGEVAAQDRAPAQLPPTPTDVKPGSITLEDVPYPYAVLYLPMTVYGQDVRMAYMDVAPSGQPNGRTVVLLHG